MSVIGTSLYGYVNNTKFSLLYLKTLNALFGLKRQGDIEREREREKEKEKKKKRRSRKKQCST
jgi:hypothetical protein